MRNFDPDEFPDPVATTFVIQTPPSPEPHAMSQTLVHMDGKKMDQPAYNSRFIANPSM
jgi:hypothetical protein